MTGPTNKELQKIDQQALEILKAKIDELPMLPQALVRILQLSSTEPDYFEQIESLAAEDPPFAVRLLRVANSAASASITPIQSLRAALTRVGAATIAQLVASLAVQRVFVPSLPSQTALWGHSVRVAVAAEAIASVSPLLEVDPDEAYLAGLLHDIGRFVMFEHAPENLQKVDEFNWHNPAELIAADIEVFKFTHSELGYLACLRWNLPDDLAQIVRRHHEQLDDKISPGSLEAGILNVELADHLALLLEHNPDNAGSEEYWGEFLSHKQYTTKNGKALISAAAVASESEAIISKSNKILSGLGVST